MRKRSNRGFTLVETVFALLLAAMGATILVAAMPTATMAYTTANYNQKAMNLAQKEIEAIRTEGFANANASQLFSVGLLDSTNQVSNNTYSFTNSDGAAPDNPALVLPSGTGTVTINQIGFNLVQVIVIVQWVNRGTPQSYELATLIANV